MDTKQPPRPKKNNPAAEAWNITADVQGELNDKEWETFLQELTRLLGSYPEVKMSQRDSSEKT